MSSSSPPAKRPVSSIIASRAEPSSAQRVVIVVDVDVDVDVAVAAVIIVIAARAARRPSSGRAGRAGRALEPPAASGASNPSAGRRVKGILCVTLAA